MFIVLLTYKKSLEDVDAHIPEHVSFLEKGYREQIFICSGRRDPRIGGVILVNLEDEEEVKKVISNDPFFIHEIADYSFIKFTPTMYADSFSCFIK
jgi:uncharacterized protein YciI